MKFNLNALAEQKFKAPVVIRMPLNEVNKEGETQYGEARFIGLFRCTPVAEARKHLDDLKRLQEANDVAGAVQLSAQQLNDSFIGFEPMPGEELPFEGLENGVCTPAAVKQLLNSREAREAIQAAYNDARSEDVLGKN